MQKSALPGGAGILAAVGAVVFTAAWLVLGLVSDGYTMWDIKVTSYSAIAQPVSGLGLGSTAPLMNAAFVGCGILISIGTWVAMGTWPRTKTRPLNWARGLVAVCGVGMALDGMFTLESILLHTLGFVLGVGSAGVGFFLGGRALRGTDHPLLARSLQIIGPLTLVGMVGYLLSFDPIAAGENVGHAGLTERILLLVLMATIAAIGLSAVARRGRTAPLDGDVLVGGSVPGDGSTAVR